MIHTKPVKESMIVNPKLWNKDSETVAHANKHAKEKNTTTSAQYQAVLHDNILRSTGYSRADNWAFLKRWGHAR